MLSWRLETSSEKAELQELNARLYDYVCRVRELERENLLLEQELRDRQGREDQWAEGQVRFASEARVLRQQLDELSWATALAEGERDALRRELRELQQLGMEERSARSRREAELGAQQRELQEALGARAALEALLGRLQEERRGLDAAHERDVRELRSRAAGLTMRYRARATGPAAPLPHLQEVHDSYAMLVAESWRETMQAYEDEVRELEEALRRGLDSRREAEKEAQLCAQEVDMLRREALELGQLRAHLEEELLRMRDDYDLQVKEQQRIIDSLEDEKADLTLALTSRLRDHQELVQVKASLSLEVATYRALLEGESNPEILIWTEHIENIPQEIRNTSYQYRNSVTQREKERHLFPRWKAAPVSLKHSAALRSALSAHRTSQTSTSVESAAQSSIRGSGYSPLTTAWQENTRDKTANEQACFRTFSPTYDLLRKTEMRLKTLPERPRTEGASDASIVQESHREYQNNRALGTSESMWSSERTVTSEKKIEVKGKEERGRIIPGRGRAKQEERMFDSKEKASEERNLRWEELTKLDKEARKRESQQMREWAKGKESLKEKNVHEREIPITLETSQESVPEVSPQSFHTSVKKDVGGKRRTETETREMKFSLDTSKAPSFLKGDSLTKTVAENIVSSILTQFTKSPDTEASADSFPDTKVTYMDRKELPGDRKTKTEIVVESKLTEEVDISSDAGLDYLLSKDVKEVGLKGKSTEQMIGDIVNLGLKGREGRVKVVNVEIVEEPMSYAGDKVQELPTPCQVEEVDDVSPGAKGLVEEKEDYGEPDSAFSISQFSKTKQPPQNLTQVEEVTEASDWEGEQSYFVSTPDEHPGGHDRDEGSVYGQIHTEEESTIKYSWQDEIVRGTRRRKTGDRLGEEEEHAYSSRWREETKHGVFHAEPTVIEKEIKIPHEFRISSTEVFATEPKNQLGEVMEQLEERLPERVRKELSALSREGAGEPGSVSVDVKEVQSSGGGSMTLVAEVNLSQTVDAHQLDLDELNRCETSEIEKAVESVVRESLTKRPSHVSGSPDWKGTETLATGIGFKRWATRELYSPSGEREDASPASPSTEPVTWQGPVSATVEVSSPRGLGQSQVLEDVSQSVRHIQIGPTAVWRTEQVSTGRPLSEVEIDVSNLEATPSSARRTQEFTIHFPTGKEAATPGVSDGGAWRGAGSKKERAEIGSIQAATGEGNWALGPEGQEQAVFDKTVQLQRMVDQRSVVSDDKKVALLYLDKEEEEESDGHWF